MRKLTDIRQFFKTLSFHKWLVIFKAYLGYYISKTIKNPIVLSHPFSLSIEAASICNLHCPECVTGTNMLSRKNPFLDFDVYRCLINELYHDISYLNLSFQGESFLNPLFFDMVKYATKKNIYTSVSTNGHFLNNETIKNCLESKLHRIIISLDGTNEDSYSKYRIGGNFSIVINGIKNLILMRNLYKSKTPYIILQFIIFKHNQHELKKIRNLANQLGVDKLILKSAQLNNNTTSSHLLTDIRKYARYNFEKGMLKIKHKHHTSCLRLWTTAVITSDGDMVPCCFDKNAMYKFGNISKTCFFNVWNSPKAVSFKQQILNNKLSIAMCSQCIF